MNGKLPTQKCRTCLKSITKTFPLTKPVTGCSPDVTYLQLLKEYAQFEYNAVYEHYLPQYLCFLCCNQLKSTYVFIQHAQFCNVKLVNNLTKQLCLQEQVIDLPKMQDGPTVFIKAENPDDHVDLEDHDIRSFIANVDNENYEDNLVTNKSFIAEPILTTEKIIEYECEFEDNLDSNKSFVADSALKTEQIIEYDFEGSVEMNNNFNTETNKDTIVTNSKEVSPSNSIETLESEDSLLEEACFIPLHKQKPLSKEQTFTYEKCPDKYSKHDCLNHTKEKLNSRQTKNLKKSQIATNKIIKCQFCDFIGKTYSGLKYHNRSKHGTEEDKLKCKFCSYTGLNKGYLLNHVKNVHKELIKTLKANAITNTDESIDSNGNNSLSENCSTYDLITPTDEENLSDNNDNEQGEEEFSDEDFIRNIINMKKKSRTKISTRALVRRCEECGKIFKNYKTLCNHQRHVHKSEDMFSVCPHCNKKCKRETDLKIHIRQKHGPEEDRQEPKPRSKEKRFMCAECSYTCTTSTILNIHINRHHTGEKPHKCDICFKSFVVPHDLKIHRYVHTGEKPYKCPICLKGFRDPSHMNRHKRLHTNKKQYTCDDCGKGFTQPYNLSVHKRTHLKENNLSCSVCGKFFKNKSMLNIHQISENHYDEIV